MKNQLSVNDTVFIGKILIVYYLICLWFITIKILYNVGYFFLNNISLNILYYKSFVLHLLKINNKMRKTRYSDVLCKAEAIASDPKNRTIRGRLRSSAQKKLDRMTRKIAFLTQFEKPVEEFIY